MTDGSLTVSELLARVQQVVVAEFPEPVWVRGEVTGYRRTSGGAAFFRLADPDVDEAALDVAGRGRVMAEVDRALGATGVGGLRNGVEIRARGTVGIERRNSVLRLSLLEVDPAFTAGRLAIDRAEVIRKLTADGSLAANALLPVPLVPLRVGLVTSRGSAAHGDFLDQLRRSPYRFAVKTVHASVQGETAPDQIAAALSRFSPNLVDVVAVVRGGGSKLDLAVFDTEAVARAVATAGVPVVTGIGHEIDRSVADEAAAFAVKTPSAAGEWLVSRVREYADRLDRARVHIRREANDALRRHQHLLQRTAADVAGGATTLRRQRDTLDRISSDIAGTSRRVLERHGTALAALEDWFSAIDLDGTLRRGFAIVTGMDGGQVIKSTAQVSPGDRLRVRIADGTVVVEVVEP
ncbi:MAG TPA: exodeoxyribonuclease VII large subunit [Acidimicrobiia bacterium]|nr:exodeoxyribonuclease VII large subunit [Acidimicrobiia bacterium]